MFYQNFLRITFRNQKILEIFATEAKFDSHPKGSASVLTVDGKIIAHLKDHAIDSLENGLLQIGSAFPQKAIYEYFPPDWDTTEKGFRLIDSIIIDTNGRYK